MYKKSLINYKFHDGELPTLALSENDDLGAARALMIETNTKALLLSPYWGWKDKSLSFLKNFDFVDKLAVVDTSPEINLSGIHYLTNLRDINLQSKDKTALDFSAFPMLKNCFLTWRKKVSSLCELQNLVYLYLDCFKEKSIGDISNLNSLQTLKITLSPIEDLSSIFECHNLRVLDLAYLSKLKTLIGIEKLQQLQELHLSGCKNLQSWVSEITTVNSLKKLLISKMGDVESILPLRNMLLLEEIIMVENTKIKDGKVASLADLPNIKEVFLQGFKHYDIPARDLRSLIRAKNHW